MDKFTVADVIRASADDEPATLKQGFHELMLDKIRDQLEAKRDQIMSQYYNDTDVENLDDDMEAEVENDDSEDEGDEEEESEEDDSDSDDEGELDEAASAAKKAAKLTKWTKEQDSIRTKMANPVQTYERDNAYDAKATAKRYYSLGRAIKKVKG